MTHYLANEKGYVGDLATTAGLSDLYAYLRKVGGAAAEELIEHGYCVTPGELLEALALADPPNGPAVRETVRNLVRMLKRCEDVAIVSNGEGLDEWQE